MDQRWQVTRLLGLNVTPIVVVHVLAMNLGAVH